MHTNRPKCIAREALRHELTGVPTSTWYDLQAKGTGTQANPSGATLAGLANFRIGRLGSRACGGSLMSAPAIIELFDLALTRGDYGRALSEIGDSSRFTDEERGAIAQAMARCWGRVS